MDWHSGVAPNITKISNHCCMICKKIEMNIVIGKSRDANAATQIISNMRTFLQTK